MEDRNEDEDKDKDTDTKDTKDSMLPEKVNKETNKGKTDVEDHKFLSKINPKNVSECYGLTLTLLV